MAVLQASMISAASQSVDRRFEFESSISILESKKSALFDAAFPYIKRYEVNDSKGNDEKDKPEDIDSLFDILDDIIKNEEKNSGEGIS